ncbi:hypothetical protein [Sulfuriroseicoccus oceanibius]|uniref:DUF2267 domain-containing protein n=1 Tax=Sulfuriroseicoccus oceanibius TaxID=2707525 RepID=A0A6B3L2W6_9BACT|nr:hypothetical protein [Sulfuriroseicoccus oceanibius]QQL46180.1 hypothetical protein G3M56_006255 [Sulfuriroseicoccus oceanibius]
MNQLVQLLQEKFNLDEDTARQIIETIAGFAKERVPENLQGLVDKALNGEDIGPDSLGGMGSILGSFFKK